VRLDSKAVLPMKTAAKVIKFNKNVPIEIWMMYNIVFNFRYVYTIQADMMYNNFVGERQLIDDIIKDFLASQGIAFKAHYLKKRTSPATPDISQ
jgi:hypothetical protein